MLGFKLTRAAQASRRWIAEERVVGGERLELPTSSV
jgi:hypothetical protein